MKAQFMRLGRLERGKEERTAKREDLNGDQKVKDIQEGVMKEILEEKELGTLVEFKDRNRK